MIGMMNGYSTTYMTGGFVPPYGTGMESASTTAPGKVTGAKDASAVTSGQKVSRGECQTCKERKYQDGSDEMVSFKSAAHISPESSGTRVRAHEQEHVSNAYKKAAQGDGKVLAATVSLRSAVCPECGRSYIAGGTTTTKIRYPNESNPYQQNRKSADRAATTGSNVDLAV